MDWSVSHGSVCESLYVCVCVFVWVGGLEGYPTTQSITKRGEGGDGDESVAHRGADDGGLYGIEGG